MCAAHIRVWSTSSCQLTGAGRTGQGVCSLSSSLSPSALLASLLMSAGGRRARGRRRAVHVMMVLALCAFTCLAMFVFTSGLQPRYCSGPAYRRESFLLPAPGGAVTRSALVLELNDSQLLGPGNDSSAPSHGLREQRGTVLMLRGRTPTHTEKEIGEATNVAVQLSHKTWRTLTKAVKEAEKALFPWKPLRVRRVNCRNVFRGNARELAKARRFEQRNKGAAIRDTLVTPLAAECSSFKKMFGFITSPLTEQERDFPIAYSLLVFRDAGQVLNLLRAIYRPQNYYCVHIDSKSHGDFREAMLAMAACFPNVFLSSRSVDVQWGTFTVLEPELVCMADLWRRGGKWKYFINLTGQEFPLRTNFELVQILTAYHGANNLEGTRQRANKGRWAWVEPPPGGIIATKGSVHIVANRDVVDFILHTTLARHFLDWVRQVDFPDEVFFSSLNHNPHLGIRGTYTGNPETDPADYPFLTRFKNWDVQASFPCASRHYVRQICILSSGDLPLLATRPELFANKFYAGESRMALDCLAESLFNRTRDQFLGRRGFSVEYYASLPFVKKAVNASTFERSVLL